VNAGEHAFLGSLTKKLTFRAAFLFDRWGVAAADRAASGFAVPVERFGGSTDVSSRVRGFRHLDRRLVFPANIRELGI
jgi:hypothetical protein